MDEAATALGTARVRIPRPARQGILEAVDSFAQLEKTALRVVALASTPNPTQAAQRLGMALVSLTRWLHRRPVLMAVLDELTADRFHADV
jgi:beta-phosphoglucomutase-like phosphatase (HAD superfamily)